MRQSVPHLAFVVISLWAAGAAGQTPAPALDFDTFRTRVQPIFTARRDGLQTCLTCHGGKVGTRLRLEPLPEGATTWSVEASRKNFESARGLVKPGAPMESRLLTHPLDRARAAIRSTAAANTGPRRPIRNGRRSPPGCEDRRPR
jgi:hypothetical protein